MGQERVKVGVLVGLSVLVAYLCWLLLLPFLPAIVWGVALAVVAHPLHKRIQSTLPNRNIAAGMAVLIITVVLVLPVVLVTQQVAAEAGSLVQTARRPAARAEFAERLRTFPRISHAVRWLQDRLDLPGRAEQVVTAAASMVPLVFAGSAAGVGQLFIALFSLYFLLRDGNYFVASVAALIPLSKADTQDVLNRVRSTIDASLRGRVLIAVLQGVLGGLMFWWLGLPAPLLWGTAMALLSTVPMLGAFLVWAPAAIFLLASGHPVKAAILTGWGVLVIGTADNFLYPILVGKDLRLHTLIIFFSVLGGVAAFGVSGLVIGPVVTCVADALIDVWKRRTGLDANVSRLSSPLGRNSLPP